MKRTIMIVLVMLTALAAANIELKAQKVYEINLTKKINTKKEVPLSSIAKDIEYIPLETTEESILSMVFRLVKTDDRFLVLDYNDQKYDRLLIFGLDGSFKKLIHSAGKGPGEYVSIGDFCYDKKRKEIVILDSSQKKLLFFTKDGDYIKEIFLDFRPFSMVYVESGHFALLIPLERVKPDEKGKLYNLFLIDHDGKITKKYESPVPNEFPANSPWIIASGIESYQDHLRIRQPFTETYYTLDNKLDKIPFAKIKMGSLMLPPDVFSSIEKHRKEIGIYIEFAQLLESDDYFFLWYNYQNDRHNLVSSKANGTLFRIQNTKQQFGFINDFDGSMRFWPRVSTGDEELIMYHNAVDLIDYCDQHNVTRYKSKFPAQQKKLLKLLENLSVEDNPVLEVVRLK